MKVGDVFAEFAARGYDPDTVIHEVAFCGGPGESRVCVVQGADGGVAVKDGAAVKLTGSRPTESPVRPVNRPRRIGGVTVDRLRRELAAAGVADHDDVDGWVFDDSDAYVEIGRLAGGVRLRGRQLVNSGRPEIEVDFGAHYFYVDPSKGSGRRGPAVPPKVWDWESATPPAGVYRVTVSGNGKMPAVEVPEVTKVVFDGDGPTGPALVELVLAFRPGLSHPFDENGKMVRVSFRSHASVEMVAGR